MNRKKICILGGGGFVGLHLASELSRRGYSLRIPTRRRDAIRSMLVLPDCEVVETNLHDPAQLLEMIRGMDVVINLVGILNEDRRTTFKDVHAELPRHLVTACREAGVKRLLHMSALGADNASPSAYQRSKAAGEARVLAAQGPELNVSVFRPSVIFGSGDSFLNLFASLLKIAPVLPLANAKARFQPVFVGDVAQAFANAIDDQASYGQASDLCGPKVYSLRELVELTARQLDLPARILPLGETSSYWFARLMELKPGRKLMTRDNHYSMLQDNVCDPHCRCQATSLESVIGYLGGTGPRSRYDAHRSQAGR